MKQFYQIPKKHRHIFLQIFNSYDEFLYDCFCYCWNYFPVWVSIELSQDEDLAWFRRDSVKPTIIHEMNMFGA